MKIIDEELGIQSVVDYYNVAHNLTKGQEINERLQVEEILAKRRERLRKRYVKNHPSQMGGM